MEAHPQLGANTSFFICESPHSTHCLSWSLQNLGTYNTRACKPQGATQQQSTWRGTRASCMGGRGETSCRVGGSSGLGWGGEGRERTGSWRARTCHRGPQEMPGRAPATPDQLAGFEVAIPCGDRGACPGPPLRGLWQAVEQTLTGMSGTQTTLKSQTQAEAWGQQPCTKHPAWQCTGRGTSQLVGTVTYNVITCPVSGAKYFCRT